MKEDILEQLIDGHFLRMPKTFTKHNVKYKPGLEHKTEIEKKDIKKYSVPSDIDILAIQLENIDNKVEIKVFVVSCKSWQSGFDIDLYYNQLNKDEDKIEARYWKSFRELVEPNWSRAFREKIFEETGSFDFTYYIAVTKIRTSNKRKEFETCEKFIKNLSDKGKNKVEIKFLELNDIIQEIFDEEKNTTLESTEIGRFMQLVKASGLDISLKK